MNNSNPSVAYWVSIYIGRLSVSSPACMSYSRNGSQRTFPLKAGNKTFVDFSLCFYGFYLISLKNGNTGRIIASVLQIL